MGTLGHPWPVRVEIPKWVAEDKKKLDLLHCVLIEQCNMMGSKPYPYLLHRATKQPSSGGKKKDQVEQLLAMELRRVREEWPGQGSAGPERGRGSASPCSASRAGRTKSSKPTSDETGFPGSPKTSVRPRTPNAIGFPGPHRDLPEDLLDPELGLDLADEVVDPDRHAAARDEDVGGEPAVDRRAGRFRVVPHRRQPLAVAPVLRICVARMTPFAS